MNVAGLFIFALCCLSCLAREPAVPVVECQLGVPAFYHGGVLKYPDFSIEFMSKTEHRRAVGGTPWTHVTFEVLDREELTIGGDLTFNSEDRANARRFDVRGKIYVAELYTSTAIAGDKRGALYLAPGAIVVWDEETARSRNPSLAKVWTVERVDPSARYFPPHAYQNGRLLSGFDGRMSSLSESGVIERIPVMEDSTIVPNSPVVAARFGERIRFRRNVLRYPGFSLLFTQENVTTQLRGQMQGVSYRFAVFGSAGKRDRESGVQFFDGSLANGQVFTVDGISYVAEMFFTTGRGSDKRAGQSGVPLRHDEMIVWDEASARASNPKLVSAFDTSKQPATRRSGQLAGGVLLKGGFTGSHMWNAMEWAENGTLDQRLEILSSRRVEYPSELSGSGFIGNVSGILFVDAEGRVERAVVNAGNESRFQEPAATSLKHWRFTRPTKGGAPVKAYAGFRFSISEPDISPPTLRWR
jgi:hypothetical protein